MAASTFFLLRREKEASSVLLPSSSFLAPNAKLPSCLRHASD